MGFEGLLAAKMVYISNFFSEMSLAFEGLLAAKTDHWLPSFLGLRPAY